MYYLRYLITNFKLVFQQHFHYKLPQPLQTHNYRAYKQGMALPLHNPVIQLSYFEWITVLQEQWAPLTLADKHLSRFVEVGTNEHI